MKIIFPWLTKFISRNSNLYQLFMAAISVVLLAFVMHLGSGALAQIQSKSSTYKPLTEIPATAQKVETGIFAMNLYNLDPSSNGYYLDFYAWFKWKGDIDPTTKLEFTNGVENSSSTKEALYEKPEQLPDGRSYQALRIQGRFVHPFTLARYPLDQQNLRILLENSVYTTDQLVYVADKVESGYSDGLSIPGWKISGFSLSSLSHQYTTNFGDPRLGTGKSEYSVLQYSLSISRPLSFFIWKLLLPLMIVVAASWGSLLLTPERVDSRIMIPITALLTTVFLQQSYSSGLPDIGYLVLLDKIYAIAYILIIASILEAIITAGWIQDDKPESYARVLRVDRTTLIVQVITLVVGVTLVILLA